MAKKRVSDKVRLAKSKNNALSKIGVVQRNPFEVKINKHKFNILGQKPKHDRGLPGVSRSKAIKKRKETLLHEYKHINKANQIKDERLGVNDKQLSLEEKMLQRYALEKKKKHDRLSQFNLNDEEDLTHLGQSLSSMTKFDDVLAVDSDDEGKGTLSAEYVEQAHFGGGMFKMKTTAGEEEKNKYKSRKDAIEEIIAKSKTAKYEKQHEKEKSNLLLNKLDSAWGNVRGLLQSSIRTEQDKDDDHDCARKDDYDMTVRSMMFDRKVAPGERKSEEELAKEKEAAIRQQEEDRLARMKGDYANKKPKHQSADALCDEFASKKNEENAPILCFPILDPPNGDENENDVELPDENQNEDEEKDSEIADQGIVDDGASLDEEDQETESDDYSDIDSGNEDDADLLSIAESEIVNPVEEKVEEKQHDDASISSFPNSYSEFTSLMSRGYTAAELTQKLRNDYAPSAGKGNKAKMIELFAHVWEHSCRVASSSPPNMNVVSSLCSHLYELCQLNLDSCSDCVAERLKRTYLYCFSRKAPRPRWPKFEMLMQLKLIKLFYSTSDFSHNIATRSMLFISNILNNCRVCNMRDIACGLFLCTLAYEYVCFSKRYIPECINYLSTCLAMAIPSDVKRRSDLPKVVSVYLNKINCDFLIVNPKSDAANKVDGKLNLVQLLDDNADIDRTDITRFQFLSVALRLSEKFIDMYSNKAAYDQIIFPLFRICEVFLDKNNSFLPKTLLNQAENLLSRMKESSLQPRKRLSIGQSKPKPLRLYDPKILVVDEPFSKRSKNISSQQREKERMLHKYKKEMKGATREIRKDARFITHQRQKEQEERDAEREAKVKRLYGMLSNQEGDVKKIKRRKYMLEI